MPRWVGEVEGSLNGFANTCIHIQLFRERLSDKVHATISKGVVGGFEFFVLQ